MGKTVLEAGADAVFAGPKGFSRRGFEYELTSEEIRDLCEFASSRGKHVRLAVNSYPDDRYDEVLWKTVEECVAFGIQALIVNDPGFCRELRRRFPVLGIHASVGASIFNASDAQFWKDCGATGIVLLCNLTPNQVKPIAAATDCELEILVHANRDFTFLGKCWLSSYCAVQSIMAFSHTKVHGSPNRGGVCYQVCRRQWVRQANGNLSTDLPNECQLLVTQLRDYLAAGVTTFKIQGREYTIELMKQMIALYSGIMSSLSESQYDLSLSGAVTIARQIEELRNEERRERTAKLVSDGLIAGGLS